MGIAIVSGALANKPWNGGNAWTRLSWVSGLRRLGFEPVFVEQIGQSSCLDENGVACAFQDSANLAYFRSTMEQVGLAGRSALVCDDGKIWGLSLDRLSLLASEAALLLNISGHLTIPEVKDRVRCRVYYDDDPGFTQFWEAASSGASRLEGHEFHFTIGENIGAPDCVIPVGNVRWRHTRPPVVLEEWPVVPSGEFRRFTTVASWRGAYGPVQYAGKTYGLKVHEFRKFIELPRRGGGSFEIALQIHPEDRKDLDALIAQGWQIADPRAVAASMDDFRRYVQRSSAEFSVAQGIYVDTNSGWFSDRTVRYLASGRPALVQDTGFSRHLPTGKGLVAFRTMEEALAGAESIIAEYDQHCLAARRVAEEHFDAEKVLRRMAGEIGLKP
jgi:hypothetical protein